MLFLPPNSPLDNSFRLLDWLCVMRQSEPKAPPTALTSDPCVHSGLRLTCYNQVLSPSIPFQLLPAISRCPGKRQYYNATTALPELQLLLFSKPKRRANHDDNDNGNYRPQSRALLAEFVKFRFERRMIFVEFSHTPSEVGLDMRLWRENFPN